MECPAMPSISSQLKWDYLIAMRFYVYQRHTPGHGTLSSWTISLVCNAIKERNACSFPQSCKAQKCWMKQRNTRLSRLKGRWKLIHLSNSTLRPKNSSSLRTTLFTECSLSVPSVPGNFQSADKSAEDCKVAESGRWQGKGQPGDPLTAQVSVTAVSEKKPSFLSFKIYPPFIPRTVRSSTTANRNQK